jgi:hypothetical protein
MNTAPPSEKPHVTAPAVDDGAFVVSGAFYAQRLEQVRKNITALIDMQMLVPACSDEFRAISEELHHLDYVESRLFDIVHGV